MQFLLQVIQKTQFFGNRTQVEKDHQKVFVEFQHALIMLSKIPQPLVRIRTIKMN